MLLLLRIKNFALIDELELEFDKGLNVLTGETGAGKSIILDAIDLVLGGKVNARTIRTGATRAAIEATFAADRDVIEWLKEREIDPLDEGSVVCSREITTTKSSLRSRSRVNGVLVNRQAIEFLRDRLVEITAQGQTVKLTIPARQRELLDCYGDRPLLAQKKQVASAWEIYRNLCSNLEKDRRCERERLQRLDLVKYQIEELESADLKDDLELEKLAIERDRLSHIVELQQLSYKAYQALYQSDSDSLAAADLLGEVESILTEMVNYDIKLNQLLEIVRTAIAQVGEAAHQINAYGASLQAEPETLQATEQRILILKQICRKYGPSLSEAIIYYQKIKQELDELQDTSAKIQKLEKQSEEAQLLLKKECEKLTNLRKKTAQRLEKQLIARLKPLAMDKVVFQCIISPIDINITGADRATFYFSPNPGEKIQPLANTASGGEMSRFLLALKASLSTSEGASQTLIFDEIDAGVSGKVARTIAEKLHQISQQQQVLCVTHQPLVAAMADAHFRVSKEIINNSGENDGLNVSEIRTVVRVKVLDNHDTRREELAQLTAGDSARDAIAFAESILAAADAHRINSKM
ncbi:MAG: DNA repair protein RecN [Prochloraceae cyanobacterium]|nr:DNA repair protein RecN [Prochloraceae cyanobacterium]